MRSWRIIDQLLRRQMADTHAAFELKAAQLVAYHTLGFTRHSEPGGASASFSGAPSVYGRQIDRMQGFSRMAPLWAAWIAGGRPAEITLPDGAPSDLLQLLAQGLTNGSDPSHPAYWGDISGRDQRICEAADIALSFWLAREPLSNVMNAASRDRLFAWLAQALDKQTTDNNWHLFIIMIGRILTSLGAGDHSVICADRWRRLQTFHLGQGWYKDGPDGPVDYYNAWAFHYALFWHAKIAPRFEAAFIRDNLLSFARQYVYLMTPIGFPAMGRSLEYRLAAPVPLVAAACVDPAGFDPGVALRGLHAAWQYFVSQGALRHGVPAQGYWRQDLRLINNYSGPASSLWSLRALIIALAAPDTQPLWLNVERPLPVETNDFEVMFSAPNWRVKGEKENLDVTLYLENNKANADYAVQSHPAWRAALDGLRGRPTRPKNDRAKYERYAYNNRVPFWMK
jgi:hypothetical protein